jgi:DNA-binding NarL/FixJ family response regulator
MTSAHHHRRRTSCTRPHQTVAPRRGRLQIIGECGNGTDAVKSITEMNPDLVFLDIQMPGKNGFEVIKSLNAKKAADDNFRHGL